MCKDEDDQWVAVEIKRIATMEAVEQLTRYLERIGSIPRCRDAADPRRAEASPAGGDACRCAGILTVEVDLESLRGRREPDLTLFP